MRADRAVEAYLRHISIERGLSEHTVAAYRRDLAVYRGWLSDHGIVDTSEVTPAIVAQFAAERASAQPPAAATSLARLQSSVRGLHRFLVREGLADTDPSERLRPPKAPQRLPKALSITQIEALLDAAGPAPGDTGATGDDLILRLRDRALLELLYATGARVSEVMQLDVDDLAHGDVLRVRGKGAKERIVPVGSYARAAVDAYLARARPELLPPGTGDPATVPRRPRRADVAAGRVAGDSGGRRAGGPAGTRVAAHVPPLLRDAPAAGRRRRPCRAGAARARLSRHDADLHARHGGRAA